MEDLEEVLLHNAKKKHIMIKSKGDMGHDTKRSSNAT